MVKGCCRGAAGCHARHGGRCLARCRGAVVMAAADVVTHSGIKGEWIEEALFLEEIYNVGRGHFFAKVEWE